MCLVGYQKQMLYVSDRCLGQHSYKHWAQAWPFLAEANDRTAQWSWLLLAPQVLSGIGVYDISRISPYWVPYIFPSLVRFCKKGWLVFCPSLESSLGPLLRCLLVMRPGVIRVNLQTHLYQSLPVLSFPLELMGNLRTCMSNKLQITPVLAERWGSLPCWLPGAGAWGRENLTPRLCGLELPSSTHFLKYRGLCSLV